MTFQLDTSGRIRKPNTPFFIYWKTLNPFEQGYAEEVLKAVGADRFDALAYEAVARIMEDCERVEDRYWRHLSKGGARFWAERQRGDLSYMPPLTPYTGKGGKVRFREGGQ